MLFRTLGELVSPEYLLYAILSPGFQERAMEAAVGTGVKHLRVGDVSALKLPLPPTAEQLEISNRVKRLMEYAEQIEANCRLASQHTDRLSPSILAKAFGGELVPQNPDDEPASELLARIQKEATEKPGKKDKQGGKVKALAVR